MKKAVALTIAILCAFPLQLFAVGSGGFENATFSAKTLGMSNATVAQADEPAAISYNPAGLTQLPGVQVQSNLAFLNVATRNDSRLDGVNYSAGTINTIPTGYVTINPGKLTYDRVVLGVGSDSPFGLGNKYDSNLAQTHFTGWRNWLKMYTIKPVVAIKATNWLSLAAGPMWYRIFDFGGIQAYPNSLATGVAASPQGQVRINLSGNAWGWFMGALLKPSPKHQIGFYYRSPVTVFTRGQIKVERGGGGGTTNFETGGQAKIELPLNMTWGYAYKPNTKTVIEADFGFTRWSAHKRLYINSDPVSAADDAILGVIGKSDKDYNNSWTIHLGGDRKITDKLSVRGGGVFYWTPVPEAHYIPAVPDSNSLGLSIGTGYALSKNLMAEATYFNRLWFSRHINNNVGESNLLPNSTVDGKYFSVLNEFIISLTYKWDNLFGGKTESQGNDKALDDSLAILNGVTK